jgi:hypothetical protein
MRNTADVTGSKPIAVILQSFSGVSAINPLFAFYDIHGRKKESNLHSKKYIIIIISLLMSLLLGHRPSLWITHKENGP